MGHAVVLDDAVPQRADQLNIGGHPSHHTQGLVAHRHNGPGTGIHRADAGLGKDDALFFGGNDDGGRPQINADVLLLHIGSPCFWVVHGGGLPPRQG